MLSILLKRRAQEQAKQKVAERVIKPELIPVVEGGTTASTLTDKPWDETQNVLKQDLAYLRTLAGSEEKDPYKQELVNKYQPLVAKLLTTHSNLGGLDVIWWFYQWQVDLGNLNEVHDCFRAAIDMGLETPNSWKSNGQTAFCDIVFKYSHTADKEGKEFIREYLQKAVLDLLEGKLATNAPLKVKMFRLVGDWHYEKGETEKAYILFEQVMALDPSKGGRKTKLNELKEELGYGDSN
ncbi:phage terminase small subunit [Vibrio sp. HN007]|uniref:phage terminase small subunit n=1 Tax=Vibrio iocasae TaxID=3098914 RepID=UPI0035D4CCA7